MQNRAECQLPLFATRLDWNEFPLDVRERVSQLLAAMCVSIIDTTPNISEERDHESRVNSTQTS